MKKLDNEQKFGIFVVEMRQAVKSASNVGVEIVWYVLLCQGEIMPRRRDVWTTVRETSWSGHVTDDDGAAAGNVVLLQVKKMPYGWVKRHVASNGGRIAKGPNQTIGEEEFEDLFSLAE